MLLHSLPPDIALIAAIGRSAAPLPERHLGLVQASELPDLMLRLDALADLVEAGGFTALPPTVSFMPSACEALPPRLAGLTVAVARDAAFSFIYPSNLATLTGMGAQLAFFSPLADDPVPHADALWLPGGYPELHAAALSGASRSFTSLRSFCSAGMPILAECGGMMALAESLETVDGQHHNMVGLLPGRTVMQKRLAALGMMGVALAEELEPIRGHAFHYSRFETTLEPWMRATRTRDQQPGEAVYRVGSLTASYFHAYFASNPEAVADLLTLKH